MSITIANICKHKVGGKSKTLVPFGCSVYVLDSELQNKAIFHKWKQKPEVGIYLGTSHIHSKGVTLVLNRNTALVSPQLHVNIDIYFQITKDIDN